MFIVTVYVCVCVCVCDRGQSQCQKLPDFLHKLIRFMVSLFVHVHVGVQDIVCIDLYCMCMYCSIYRFAMYIICNALIGVHKMHFSFVGP